MVAELSSGREILGLASSVRRPAVGRCGEVRTRNMEMLASVGRLFAWAASLAGDGLSVFASGHSVWRSGRLEREFYDPRGT